MLCISWPLTAIQVSVFSWQHPNTCQNANSSENSCFSELPEPRCCSALIIQRFVSYRTLESGFINHTLMVRFDLTYNISPSLSCLSYLVVLVHVEGGCPVIHQVTASLLKRAKRQRCWTTSLSDLTVLALRRGKLPRLVNAFRTNLTQAWLDERHVL